VQDHPELLERLNSLLIKYISQLVLPIGRTHYCALRPPFRHDRWSLINSLLVYQLIQSSKNIRPVMTHVTLPEHDHLNHWNSSQDDNERIFWFIFCSSKSGRSCTDCCMSCHSFPFSLSASTLVSVFKPKDEEPYGWLNPKVRIFFTSWKASTTQMLQDYEVDSLTVSVDHTIWEGMPYTQS